MKKLITAAAAALIFAALPGCKGGQDVAASIAVQAATMKYIERVPAGAERQERAARVARVAKQIHDATDGLEVTVAALQQLAIAALPADLEPSDRMLANAIIQLAVTELQLRIGEGELPADKLVKVRTVVGWVQTAASFYAPPS